MRLRKVFSIRILLLIVIIIIIFVLIFGFVQNYGESEFFIMLPNINESEKLLAKPNELLNITNFEYILDNKLCAKLNKKILAILLVTSYVGHDELRAAHRQAITQTELLDLGLLRVFVLADIPAKEHFITQAQLNNEQERFADLLQGNFQESYRNLSYKHIMGLRWAISDCNKSKFIIKLDDDIVFDVFHWQKYLKSLLLKESNIELTDFLAGYVLPTKPPIRNMANKWFVSRAEYPHSTYPAYLSGWLYVTNMRTALRLVNEAQKVAFFWIDDTWVTGVLRARLRIPMLHLNNWYSANEQFLQCCIRDVQQYNYECTYFVGPNGGQNKLITEFLHHVKKCYSAKCSKRPANHLLNQTCVGEAKHIMPDHGQPQIQPIKLR